MLSDQIITLAGKTITITSHDLFMAGFSLVTGLLFWGLVYFSRKRIVVMKRSSASDQLTHELMRIAEALERIANRPAVGLIEAALRGQRGVQPAMPRESKGRAYSMFGQ